MFCDNDTSDHLRGAFEHITGLLLRQQIADFQARQPAGSFVHPERAERACGLLKGGFRAVNTLCDRLKAELTGDVFRAPSADSAGHAPH